PAPAAPPLHAALPIFGRDLVEAHQLQVAPALEPFVLVQHVGDAAAHAGGEVAPGPAQHDHPAAGHVLAPVVAAALDHGPGVGVAHGDALAGQPPEEGAPARGAVEHGAAHDDA